jgi:carbon-monoxide dehydrogenase medium subunit
VKPANFEYYVPRTLEECVELLSEHGAEARVLAGGQSLVPLMNLRMATPEVLIDLNRVPGLGYIRRDRDVVAIGAMTRYSEVETSPVVREHCPMLARATAQVGYPAIRSRGTVGGTLAHADPVAEWPCVALTLDAQMVVHGPTGRRTVPAKDFFTGLFSTDLAPDEVLTEVRFPIAEAGERWAFEEFAHKTGDYAVVAVAVRLGIADGVVASARAGFANLADRPVRSAAVEDALSGRPVGSAREIAESAARALRGERSGDEAMQSRVDLAAVMLGRALSAALSAAPGEAA